MFWTQVRPMTTGLYWFQGSFRAVDTRPVHCAHPTILEIVYLHKDLFAKIPGEHWWLPVGVGIGKWAGPLECPK